MVAREPTTGSEGERRSTQGGDAERETDKEGGGGTRRFRRALEAWPGKAVRHSGSDGGGSEPITYYNCLASERSERGAPVRHPSSRRMVSLPITSAVIANFSRPCLLLASSCRCRSVLLPPPIRRFHPLHGRRRRGRRRRRRRHRLRYLFVLISLRK